MMLRDNVEAFFSATCKQEYLSFTLLLQYSHNLKLYYRMFGSYARTEEAQSDWVANSLGARQTSAVQIKTRTEASICALIGSFLYSGA